jgi:hypothetical protein
MRYFVIAPAWEMRLRAAKGGIAGWAGCCSRREQVDSFKSEFESLDSFNTIILRAASDAWPKSRESCVNSGDAF